MCVCVCVCVYVCKREIKRSMRETDELRPMQELETSQVHSDFQNCFVGWEGNNNPPDLSWLEVISGTKENAVSGCGWRVDLNYH